MKLSYRKASMFVILICLLLGMSVPSSLSAQVPENRLICTFSIVARDSAAGELGVAVASRFFAVGTVVPWAEADAGAVATQSFANTSFGPRGLEMLKKGMTPEEVLKDLLKNDDNPEQRQVGIVSRDGKSVTYTGSKCLPWAGGRSGRNYAVQGNILTGEDVVINMEKTFLSTKGTLADRMYAALLAGDKAGGDSRGKQSAALIVVKDKAGYGGYNDRAIDIRVDDSKEPFKELGRLLNYAQMNYAWNEGWTLFTEKKPQEALPYMDHAVSIMPDNPELLYDYAIIELAAGKKDASLGSLKKAISLNPKLKKQAQGDNDLQALRDDPQFKELIK
ncbi:MAG TPA: DUF1028 domain-containing protein [Ignavibacteriales bacterium]|nr:DUF1028 domain-containing protein [Ignavibacteriales bacterium]